MCASDELGGRSELSKGEKKEKKERKREQDARKKNIRESICTVSKEGMRDLI